MDKTVIKAIPGVSGDVHLDLAPFLNPDAKFEVLFTDYFHFRCYVVRSGQLFELTGRVVYEDQGALQQRHRWQAGQRIDRRDDR